MKMKICNTCKIEKSLDDFPVNRLMNDKRESKCKKCKVEYQQQKYLQRKKDREISHF